MAFDLHKHEFLEYGYTIIPAVFTREEAEKMNIEARRLLDSLLPRHPNLQIRNGYPALLFGPSDLSLMLNSFSHSARMKNIVRSFLGPDVFQLNSQIYFRNSGDGDQFAWHQDICFRTPPEDFLNIEEGYLQTIICLDPIDDNGAIEFIPRSHKRGNLELIPRDNSERGLRKFHRNGWNGIKVKANPGDVLLWSVMIVHGSEPNTSGKSRMTFMNGFARKDAVLNKTKFAEYRCAVD